MLLFRIGTVLIGFGGGLFAVGTLTAAMALARDGESGLALGAWGAVQATAAGGRASRSAAAFATWSRRWRRAARSAVR